MSLKLHKYIVGGVVVFALRERIIPTDTKKGRFLSKYDE